MPEFGRVVLAAICGAGLVILAQWWLQSRTAAVSVGQGSQYRDSGQPAGPSVQKDDVLGAQLSELQRGHAQLQAEVAELRTRLSDALGPDDPGDRQAVAAPVQVAVQNQPANAALILERLTATGVAAEEAEALVQRLDELAMARLQADYQVQQATGDTEMHRAAREARRRIPRDAATIREEFGDRAYDSYLYASGQPNRVEVASVLRSSAAVVAGVQPGDVLRSLDGQPLYSVRDLTSQVRTGSPDQTYALSVERDGQLLEVWVPGGPLGVRVSGKSAAPGN